jgi:hypothetical protein
VRYTHDQRLPHHTIPLLQRREPLCYVEGEIKLIYLVKGGWLLAKLLFLRNQWSSYRLALRAGRRRKRDHREVLLVDDIQRAYPRRGHYLSGSGARVSCV